MRFLYLLALPVLLCSCTTLDVHRRTETTGTDGSVSRTDNTASLTQPNWSDIQQIWSIASPIIGQGLSLIPGWGTIATVLGGITTVAAGGYGIKKRGDAKAASDAHASADKAWDEATAHTHALYAQPPVASGVGSVS